MILLNLSDYKRVTGITYSEIASRCGVTAAMISLVASGAKTPSFDLAVKIEHATGGIVTRENWYAHRPAEIMISIGGVSA